MPSVGKEWHTFKIVNGVKYQVRHVKKKKKQGRWLDGGWQTRLLYEDGRETEPMTITDTHGTRLWIGIKRGLRET
jgi:hypothetical protein